jgi:hypothetical protein
MLAERGLCGMVEKAWLELTNLSLDMSHGSFFKVKIRATIK